MDQNYDGKGLQAWKSFEQSGKVSDYLKYNEYKQDTTTMSKVGTNAAKDQGNNFKTT